jgi:hypothetical protein
MSCAALQAAGCAIAAGDAGPAKTTRMEATAAFSRTAVGRGSPRIVWPLQLRSDPPDAPAATSSSAEAALRRNAATYRRALWDDAPVIPEVWLTKEALAGVLVEVTEQREVGFLHSAAEAIDDGYAIAISRPCSHPFAICYRLATSLAPLAGRPLRAEEVAQLGARMSAA